MSRFHHCMVTNQPYHKNVIRMQQDASVLGWGKIKVLGDPTMTIRGPDYYGRKLILVKEYLSTLPPMDIVLVTDAHDIRVLATPDEVKQAFLSFHTRVLVAAEKNCYPIENAAEFYRTHMPSNSGGYSMRIQNTPDIHCKYVNSGGYIGYVKDLLFLLGDEDLHLSVHTDDQDVMSFLYLKYQDYPDFIKLDTQCKIFQCLHMAIDDIDLQERINKCTGEKPLIYHANGGGNDMSDFFWKNICAWELPIIITQNKQKYSEESIIQKLYESCSYHLPLDTSILDEIHHSYPDHSIIHYMTGVYYMNIKNVYMASHYFKRSIVNAPLFTHPRFELATLYLKVFMDTDVHKYMSCIYDCLTTNHPTNTKPEYNLLDQLRVVSLLGPYYEKHNKNKEACDVYLQMYTKLVEKEKELATLPQTETQIYTTCWKHLCDGLARVDPSNKDKYWIDSWRDFPR